MADRQVRIIIAADVAQAIRGMRDVESGLGRIGQAGTQAATLGDKLKSGFAMAGMTVGIAAVGAALTGVVKSGMDFDSNMHQLQAVTGASGLIMEAVGAKAQALGNDIELPGASASDAAEAMLELAKGGLTVQQAMQAAKGTLTLAAAAQISGAQAATIQSNALNAFGLSADNAGHVADVLANTANKSAGTITDFAAGMQQSATVAHAYGISLEDTSTVLGEFANAGVKGSDAGTSFKTMLTALASPTKQQSQALTELGVSVWDAQGKFVGMRAVTEQLTAAKARMTDQDYQMAASTAFGTDAIRAANILAAGGVQAWDDMSAAVAHAGGAQEVAAANTQGLNGAVGNLKNSIENAALSLYQGFQPALTAVVTGLAGIVGPLGEAVSWFAGLDAPVRNAAIAFGALILLKGPMIGLWTAMKGSGVGVAIQGEMMAAKLSMQSMRLEAAATGTSFSTLGAGMRIAGAEAVAFGTKLKAAFMSNWVGLALTAVATAITFFISQTNEAAASTSDFSGAIDENTGALSANAPAAIAAGVAHSGSADAFEKIGGNVKDYTSALIGNSGALDVVHTKILDAATAGVESSSVWATVGKAMEAQGKSARSVASDILATGDAGKYSSAGLTDAMNVSRLFASESDQLGTSQRQQKQAIEGATAALDGNAAASSGAATPLGVFATTMESAGTSADGMKPAIDGLKGATNDLTSAAAFADAAVQFLSASLDAASGHAISMEQATRLNEAAIRNITSANSDYAAAQDGVTEAGLKVKEAQDKLNKAQSDGKSTAEDITQAQLDLAAANRTNDLATGKVTDATDKQFQANIQAQDSALKLATSIYTNAAANGDLQGAADQATQSLQASKDAFIAAQPEADRLSGKAQVTADKLFGIPKDTVARIAETGAAATQAAAQGVTTAVGGIPGFKSVQLTAQDNASGIVDHVQSVINGLHGKTVNIDVVTTQSGASVYAGGTLVAGSGGVTGGNVGKLAGFVDGGRVPGFGLGGKLPGQAPDPGADNLRAVGPGGQPFGLQSEEWIVNTKASKYYGDAMMAQINNMTFPKSLPNIPAQFAPQWGGSGGGQAGATVTLNADVTTTGDPAKVVNDTMFQLRAMYL